MALERIVMHWTAGGNSANQTDLKHYHEIVEGDGTRVLGNHRPEANISTADGVYAAHTRAFNTGAIGLSVAGMAGAEPHPFKAGNSPINSTQLAVFVEMVAEYAETYNIEINRKNVLTHAEVQITHGVDQAGKWDITWLPGMKRPGDPIEVGDQLRKMIIEVHTRNFGRVAERSDRDRPMEALLSRLVDLLEKERA